MENLLSLFLRKLILNHLISLCFIIYIIKQFCLNKIRLDLFTQIEKLLHKLIGIKVPKTGPGGGVSAPGPIGFGSEKEKRKFD